MDGVKVLPTQASSVIPGRMAALSLQFRDLLSGVD